MGNNKLQTGKFIDEECKQIDVIFMVVARNYRDLIFVELAYIYTDHIRCKVQIVHFIDGTVFN